MEAEGRCRITDFLLEPFLKKKKSSFDFENDVHLYFGNYSLKNDFKNILSFLSYQRPTDVKSLNVKLS